MTTPETLATIDAYLDAVPRSGADAVDCGPFTVFISRGPWGYYARPSHLRRASQRFTATEVVETANMQRAYEQVVSFEWVVDCDPSLASACQEAGLEVITRPLLSAAPAAVATLEVPPGIRIEVLTADHPLLPDHRAVAEVGFSNGGTERGEAGVAERDARAVDQVSTGWLASRIDMGTTIAVAAIDETLGIVGVGSVQPVLHRDRGILAAELTGIAVLPTHRRRGLGAAIASALGIAAGARGVELLMLSAQDDDVARIYECVGFHRTATFAEAAPLMS